MAKTKDPPKPMFPLKHEFYASLDEFVHCAGMLADMVRIVVKENLVDARVKDVLAESLANFTRAQSAE